MKDAQERKRKQELDGLVQQSKQKMRMKFTAQEALDQVNTDTLCDGERKFVNLLNHLTHENLQKAKTIDEKQEEMHFIEKARVTNNDSQRPRTSQYESKLNGMSVTMGPEAFFRNQLGMSVQFKDIATHQTPEELEDRLCFLEDTMDGLHNEILKEEENSDILNTRIGTLRRDNVPLCS